MFGWRYNIETDRIEINAYVHDDDLYAHNTLNRYYTEPIYSCKVEDSFRCEIRIEKNTYDFYVNSIRIASIKAVHVSKKNWEIRNSFGGSKPPPHWIKINIKRL
jgi:hypothetical protein